MLLPAVPDIHNTGLASGSHLRVGVACESVIQMEYYSRNVLVFTSQSDWLVYIYDQKFL